MANLLIVTEKPSVGKAFFGALGVHETEKHVGYIEGFSDFFGCTIWITWCVGHLVQMSYPEAYEPKYKQWRYEDLPILPSEFKYEVTPAVRKQFEVVKKLMNSVGGTEADKKEISTLSEDKNFLVPVTTIINACDAGREGQLIFRLVYDYLKCTKPIYRLWISSMEDDAIRNGFAKLQPDTEYNNLYHAALCRAQADWLVGYNATRLFSVLYGVTLNTGRVQSPTLAMLVGREADIAAFVKEPFYTPTLDLGSFTASGDKLKDRAAADAIAIACDNQSATVTELDRVQKTAAPPKLYDLTTLQRDANRVLGYTAQQTLDYVQALYEKKLISYPRTDARHITADMEDTVLAILGDLGFMPDIKRLVGKVSDHHAILPTLESRTADISAIPSGEREIYNLIHKRLITAVSPKHTYEAVTVTIDCAGNIFTVKGKTVITAGWKSQADNKDEGEYNAALPELSKGQIFGGVAAFVKEGATTPPKHFTEDTLLSAMETAGKEDMPEDAEHKGLGTPATRAATIERLVKSGFMERKKKKLLPTDKGKKLIAVLPDALTSPMLTAKWEQKLSQVERNELSANEFMDGIAAFTKAIVADNAAPKPEILALFPQVSSQTGDALGSCTRCGSPVREGKKGYFCDNSNCGFKLWKASRFWTAKKKPLTAAIVKALLGDGCAAVKGLYSEKSGKKYDATVILDDTGGQYVNFKLEFSTGRTKK